MKSNQTARYYTIVLSVLLGSAIYMSSCTYDVATPNVCFQQDVLPIFVSKCANAGCHNPIDFKEKLDFTNYEGIMKEVDHLHLKTPLLMFEMTLACYH